MLPLLSIFIIFLCSWSKVFIYHGCSSWPSLPSHTWDQHMGCLYPPSPSISLTSNVDKNILLPLFIFFLCVSDARDSLLSTYISVYAVIAFLKAPCWVSSSKINVIFPPVNNGNRTSYIRGLWQRVLILGVMFLWYGNQDYLCMGRCCKQ